MRSLLRSIGLLFAPIAIGAILSLAITQTASAQGRCSSCDSGRGSCAGSMSGGASCNFLDGGGCSEGGVLDVHAWRGRFATKRVTNRGQVIVTLI